MHDDSLFGEALMSFLLLLQLRKVVRTFSPNPGWEQWLKQAMIVIGVFYALDVALPIGFITQWIWHLILAGIIVLALNEPLFSPARSVINAVFPLAVLSVIETTLANVWPGSRNTVLRYLPYAYPVAFTWLIALLILSRKQTKALKEEHKRRLEEEEQSRAMAARKAELEVLVAERTAELLLQKNELQQALKELKATQTQLIQREKMASLGELTAGIAHEIQNPLNFVNNFSEISQEMLVDLREAMDRGDRLEIEQVLTEINDNLQKIHHHGDRAGAIVKSMLQHSRKPSNQKEMVDLNALAEEYLRLSYHGIRARDKLFTAVLETNFDPSLQKLQLNEQEISRVLINLFNNAFYAVNEKKKRLGERYDPLVQVVTKRVGSKVELRVKDNGTGIPVKVREKIFQPFFTTKPTGEGTGLGLSLSYDIVTKGHGGEMLVESTEGEGTEFIVQLPLHVLQAVV